MGYVPPRFAPAVLPVLRNGPERCAQCFGVFRRDLHLTCPGCGATLTPAPKFDNAIVRK